MAYGSDRFTVTSVTLRQSKGRRRKRRSSYEELAKRVDELERAYNEQFKIVVEAMQRLMRPSVRKRRLIGSRAKTVKK